MRQNNQTPTTESLRDLQDYIWQMNIDRGFNTEDVAKKMLMLTEEVGELAKALRKHVGMKFTETTETTDIAEEIGDVMIVLLGLSSMVNVDALEAIRAKETKNRERTWK